MDRPPERILVITVARIGDVLFATPAIHALKAAFPGASVDVVSHRKRIEVLRNNPDIRTLIKYTWPERLKGRLRRGRPYDLVFAYGTDPGVFRYARAVGKYTVGFAQPDGAVNRLLDQVVERPRTPIHAVDDRMSLVQGAGVLQCDRKLVYRVTDEEKEEARVFLERQAAGRGVTRIGFQVAGYPKRAFRDWPTDRFIALGRQILGNLGAKILLFGDGACADKARTIGTALGPDAVMLAGKTSLRRFGALLSECAALVTTETGPLHLAFALGVPTVALLHCLTPVELIGPTAHVERHRLLQLDPPAGTECSKHLSMELIQSEQAWEALQDILGTAEGPGGVPGGAPAKERG